jgi:vacuolar-type H+-ATPase subunit I/STV1
MGSKGKPDIRGLIMDSLQEDGIIKSICDALMDKLVPRILAKLKELNEFNSEFSHEFESYKEEQEKRIKQTEREVALKVDRIEQHDRLSAVRVYGLEESTDDDENEEDTTTLVAQTLTQKLRINVKATDIDISHRLGFRKEDADKPRSIIVKFVRRDQRLAILRARRKLRGSGVSIQPDLTRPRARVLNQAAEKFKDQASVWSDFNGRIWRSATKEELKKNKKTTKYELLPESFPGIFAKDEKSPVDDGEDC